MANIKSAKKRAAQATTRHLHNMQISSKVRTAIKKTDLAIKAHDLTAATALMKTAQSESAKAARKNLFKQNKVARDISRLNKRLKILATSMVAETATNEASEG